MFDAVFQNKDDIHRRLDWWGGFPPQNSPTISIHTHWKFYRNRFMRFNVPPYGVYFFEFFVAADFSSDCRFFMRFDCGQGDINQIMVFQVVRLATQTVALRWCLMCQRLCPPMCLAGAPTTQERFFSFFRGTFRWDVEARCLHEIDFYSFSHNHGSGKWLYLKDNYYWRYTHFWLPWLWEEV